MAVARAQFSPARHNWDKVILLNPIDYMSAFEIKGDEDSSMLPT